MFLLKKTKQWTLIFFFFFFVFKNYMFLLFWSYEKMLDSNYSFFFLTRYKA